MRIRRTPRDRELKTGRGAPALAALAALAACAALGACVAVTPPTPGIGEPIDWSALPGWREDTTAAAWPALRAGCARLSARPGAWRAVCEDAALLGEPDDATARAFFETRFTAHRTRNAEGGDDGLITGYYEPLLHGSFKRDRRYRFPLYRRPDDLLIVDLGELYPELAGKRLRGRLAGRRVVPFFSRGEIERTPSPLNGNELLWVDDPVELFFLQVQGSGRVRLSDGRVLRIGYADQNGHPYVSIGRRLVELGELTLEESSLPAIREWLARNPARAEAILNSNPSYVFFELSDPDIEGAVGSLRVPLVPERAIAVDPAFIPLGLPVWLDTSLPTPSGPLAYRRLMFAQDTGGAIKGSVRADVFFGYGEAAAYHAGHMRERGRLYVLLPKGRGESEAADAMPQSSSTRTAE